MTTKHLFAGLVALLLLVPMVPGLIYPIFVMKVMAYGLFACAFNLLLGFTGLVSFAHAAFLGTALLHLASNTFNDYFDWTSGTDQGNNDYFLPFSGGSRSIELGLITELRNLRRDYALEITMPSMRCVGYRQAWHLLEQFPAGPVPTDSPAYMQFREQGMAATRQLAKRQLTWLRGMPGRHIVACDQAGFVPQVLRLAQAVWLVPRGG